MITISNTPPVSSSIFSSSIGKNETSYKKRKSFLKLTCFGKCAHFAVNDLKHSKPPVRCLKCAFRVAFHNLGKVAYLVVGLGQEHMINVEKSFQFKLLIIHRSFEEL